MTRFSAQAGGLLQVAGAGVLIGTLGVCVREAHQNAWVSVWFRCVVGAVTVAVLARQLGWTLTLPRNSRAWLATLACGLLMTLTWALFFTSLGHLSIAVATVVFQVQPLILMAWGVIVLHEFVSLPQWTAAVAALVGIALVALPPLRASLPDRASALMGVVQCIGAAACFTGVTLIARRATVSTQCLAWSQCVVGAVCLSWAPLVHGLPPWGIAWAWLFDLGAVHTGLAYVLLYTGIRRINTVQVALLQFVSPIAAVLVDWCVYRKLLEAMQLFGLVLTIVALATALKSSGKQSQQAGSLSLSIVRSKIMISRLWRGIARVECADSYIQHLQKETIPAIRTLPGFKRAAILHRPCDRGTEFLIITEWESEQAVAAFAGNDVLVAVVPEKVQRMMVEFDACARHYTTIG